MGEVAFIGFGEAGMALAPSGARGYDLRQDEEKREDFRRCGVSACSSAAEAVSGAAVIFSLVTADQALTAARTCAPHLDKGALWLDLNSVSPGTKRAAAAVVEAVGARYVDVAVMAPVWPALRAVPLLIAGPHAEAGSAALAGIGFRTLRAIEGPVGAAAAVKMIRSVMIKGIEALSAECALAAAAADVLPEVIASLDASDPGADWGSRFDYHLDRMLLHGTRRAAEMNEVVATLDALGTGSTMASAARDWQAELGRCGMAPPAGLDAKLAALQPRAEQAA